MRMARKGTGISEGSGEGVTGRDVGVLVCGVEVDFTSESLW